MVVVGGLTRLSRSGLSIVEWKPITGALPPLSHDAWLAEYAKYQASPEGTLVNADMGMAAFQRIFLVEWAHRLLGRITGLVVLLPMLFFFATRRLSPRRTLQVLGLFVLGGLQGLAGWLMVKSGLVDQPHVSHYRLTIHLTLALLLFSLTLWVALSDLVGRRTRLATDRLAEERLSPWALGTLAIISLTVVWGGLMAGLHAGLVAPTFPTMNGQWIPAGLWVPDGSLLQNLMENPIMVHFVHRVLGFATALGVSGALLMTFTRRASALTRRASLLMFLLVTLQIALGALTVVFHVPMAVASLHQLNATLLLGCAVAFFYGVRRT
jgi:cytochrome c oxidase assembly protein subunit 15